jgi:ribosomal protein S9
VIFIQLFFRQPFNSHFREILLSPMIVTGLLGEVDVIAEKLEGPGGHSVIPRSVRHAAAIGLAVLFPNYAERLRLAGLLNPDVRTRERSKVGQ